MTAAEDREMFRQIDLETTAEEFIDTSITLQDFWPETMNYQAHTRNYAATVARVHAIAGVTGQDLDVVLKQYEQYIHEDVRRAFEQKRLALLWNATDGPVDD